jgi:hypothetical protein
VRFDQKIGLIEWVSNGIWSNTGGKPQKPTQLRPFLGEMSGLTENWCGGEVSEAEGSGTEVRERVSGCSRGAMV